MKKTVNTFCPWLWVGIAAGIAGVMMGGLGWISSDARALDRFSHKEGLNTPAKVFDAVTQRWHPARISDPLPDGQGIQAMLARPSRRLWCDEGAIVLSLLIQRLGMSTRLVDLMVAGTGRSLHTTLQVYQGDRWVTYDFSSRRFGIPLSATVPYRAVPRYRNYPASPLHWLLLHNGVARAVVATLRAHTP
jgi:hypothetical protein